MTNPFQGLSVPLTASASIKRRYSVTQDVVSYRRCARQYGAFNVHNYAPAHQTQLYFGTVLHQVLDRCHGHFQGLVNSSTKGQVPDQGRVLSDAELQQHFADIRNAIDNGQPQPAPPTDLVRYFLEVEQGLRSQGIRAITPDLRLKALRIIQYFNALEGPELYARVRDTELRLQADRQSHILHGVVDLLVENPNNADPSECEIWDYKGMSRVGLLRADLQTYLFQMRVYAHLYELKFGVLPKRVVLYFLGELDGDRAPHTRPANATLELAIHNGMSSNEIGEAMQAFADTVKEIETSRAQDHWPAASPGEISEQDCAICDLRWDCATPNGGQGVALRYP
ncbi:PD-(D/E)XK nuclease family protein [uncultured Thiohalocapsa sp.]|uniref:PD-(D/E)XK nuclease family protein n=1 Tax=uncultured Thiohalocapsa sp. TaxID=768990 RepID=UPI0025E278AF|nr:PD-(D/E)XK nuclease family protein [uncultured Thiohalocapsa sp.]